MVALIGFYSVFGNNNILKKAAQNGAFIQCFMMDPANRKIVSLIVFYGDNGHHKTLQPLIMEH